MVVPQRRGFRQPAPFLQLRASSAIWASSSPDQAVWAVVRFAPVLPHGRRLRDHVPVRQITYKSVEIEPFFLHCYVVTAVWRVRRLAVLERFRRVPAPLLGLLVPLVLAAS
jgi:hypothetical protein